MNEMIKNVHQNAIDHGFWDEDRPLGETFALIHSELSEALEEYRAGRPNVWYGEGGKPEGICVELIDAAIRMMDFMGSLKGSFDFEFFYFYTDKQEYRKNIPVEINRFHSWLADIYEIVRGNDENDYSMYMFVNGLMDYVHQLGEDPEKLLLEKHEFNTKRPYKHGKVC